jgi:hypothetical protein
MKLIPLLLACCLANTVLAEAPTGLKLKINKNVSLTRRYKFRVFALGQSTDAKALPESGPGGYCAFENIRMEKHLLRKGELLDVRVTRIEFPNPAVIRYSLIDGAKASPQLFCDFTRAKDFDAGKVVWLINRELGDWARIAER